MEAPVAYVYSGLPNLPMNRSCSAAVSRAASYGANPLELNDDAAHA